MVESGPRVSESTECGNHDRGGRYPRVRSHMQVSRDAEGRSKCVPRLHGAYRAPASRLAGQDSGDLRAGHFSCEVERNSPGYQHHGDSMNGHVAGSSHALARRRAQSNSLDPYASRWAFKGSNADLDIAAESREKT